MNTPVLKSHQFLMLLAFLALLTCPLASTNTPRAADPDFAAIDAYVKAQMKELRIPGLALAVVQDDHIVHLKGFGIADPSGRQVTPQTPFRIASVTKPLTALAVMQLVEAGKIELDAPVQRYLPWFGVAAPVASAEITVRHLLYHSSGLSGHVLNNQYYNGDLSGLALERNVRRLATAVLNRPVGSSYEYSNLNYDVLGLIVQAVSEQSYESYVEQHIFAPLEMRHSFTLQAAAEAQGLATGYRRWFGIPVPATLPDERAFLPSSSLIASAEDLSHFLIAMLNGGRYQDIAVLSPAGMAELQRPVMPIADSGLMSAMGFTVGTVAGTRVVAKTGGTANYYARIVLVPESDWGVVIQANTNDIGAGNIFNAIADGVVSLLLGEQPPLAPKAPLGGYGPIKLFLGAVVVVEVIQMVRLWRSWRRRRAKVMASRWQAVREVGLPLLASLGVALVVLVLLPRLMQAPLSFLFYFTPDMFWLTIAAGTIPLASSAMDTALLL